MVSAKGPLECRLAPGFNLVGAGWAHLSHGQGDALIQPSASRAGLGTAEVMVPRWNELWEQLGMLELECLKEGLWAGTRGPRWRFSGPQLWGVWIVPVGLGQAATSWPLHTAGGRKSGSGLGWQNRGQDQAPGRAGSGPGLQQGWGGL